MIKSNELEKILWSIAFPGFGQFLNSKIIKGIVFIILEFLINVQSHLNDVIVASFHGDIQSAIKTANYQWLLFYPCVYLFAIWDAYQDAGGGKQPYSFLPFVCSAYIGTIGVACSPSFTIMGVILGPIWLGIIGLVVGVGIGWLFRLVIRSVLIRD